MHLYCQYSEAILLVGIPDQRGTLYFPSENEIFPGLHLSVKALTPIVDQLLERIQKEFTEVESTRTFATHPDFCDEVWIEKTVALYIGLLGTVMVPKKDWQTLPQLLGKMPKNRKRLPYLRAWQVFTGGLTQETRVMESKDLSV